jgi:hypothetical protein
MRNVFNSTSFLFQVVRGLNQPAIATKTALVFGWLAFVTAPQSSTAQTYQSHQSGMNSAAANLSSNNQRVIGKANHLDGSVENIKHVISKLGFQFRVSFEQIRYHAEIESIDVVDRNSERIHVRVMLKQLKLTVGRTEIKGKRHHALCGPFAIQIGNQRIVEVNFVLRNDREGALQLVDSQFRLDRNNWTIGRPQTIEVRGFGMTQNRVAIELKNGLNSNAGIVEAKVIEQLPAAYESIAASIATSIKDNQFQKRQLALERRASERRHAADGSPVVAAN